MGDLECGEGFQVEQSLLRLHRDDELPAAVASSLVRTSKKAVALRGGGFRALADYTALVEGLLAVLGQSRIGKHSATMAELFSEIETISGVSGCAPRC